MKILLVSFLIIRTFIGFSQTIVADTNYYVNPSGGWYKTITYRNAATTTTLIKADTSTILATASKLAFKTDSLAVALAASTAQALALKQNLLGFTPYNATNPSGYISVVPAQTFASLTGKPTTLAGYGITDNILLANGNGSSLTGLTKTQVGLANADNTSDANKPLSSADVTALAGKQATLVSATNIKTINGSTVLGSGDLVVSGSGAPTFLNLANNFSSTSITPAAVTGWSFAVTTGKTYRITVIADYQTAATTTGGILGISLTTATGTVRGWAIGTVVNTAAATELTIPIRATSGAGSTLTTTGVTAINSPHYIGMDITFTCTNTGTFNIVWATEIAASASQLNQNSTLLYQALN